MRETRRAGDMRAAVFHGRGDVRVERRAIPEPAPDEVLVRVTAAGICGSDATEFAHGPLAIPLDQPHGASHHVGPLIMGHEFAGEVVSAPRDATVAVGTPVVCGAGIACGACRFCRAGRTNLCERYFTIGFHRHGGLAEYVTAPAGSCVDTRPYGLSPDAAALAQPTAIAVHALRRSRLRTGERALVIGAGGVGAFLAYGAIELGAVVTVADLNDDRLRIAQALGAAATIRVSATDTGEPYELFGSTAPDVIFEVSGSASGFEAATALAGPGTRIVVVGVHKVPREIDLLALIVKEAEVLGTIAHVCDADIPEALRLLATRDAGWSDVAPIALSLDRVVVDGLEPIAAGTSPQIKTLVDPTAHVTRAANVG